MKREIKFRAWSPKYEKYLKPFRYPNGHDGLLLDINTGKLNIQYEDDEGFIVKVPVKSYQDIVLEQYTGLRDSSGTDIYEGDIIKCHYFYQALGVGLGVYEGEEEITGQIVFEDMGLWIECEDEDDSGYLLRMNGLHEESFKIIGNIHQTPELLTK